MRKLWPLMVLVVTSACLSDTSGAPTASKPGTTDSTVVAIAPATTSVVIGQAVQYQATVAGSSGVAVAWSVSNPNIASVTGSGLLTGVASGTATLTAAAMGRSAALIITVGTGAVDRVSACDRSNNGGCAASASLAFDSTAKTAVAVRASAYNAFGADISGSCVFAWTPLKSGIVTIQLSTDATKRDALITRAASGPVSILVTCGSVIGVFTVN